MSDLSKLPEFDSFGKRIPLRYRRLVAGPTVKRGLLGRFYLACGMLVSRLHAKIIGRGMENIPETGPCVIAANHETYVDGMWIMELLNREQFKRTRALAAQDLAWEHGFFGRVILRGGNCIPIDRKGNPARGLIQATRAVRSGDILIIHPEGTRTRDGYLCEMQKGATFVAFKAKAPLIPCFIDGGFEVFGAHHKVPHFNGLFRPRHRVIVTFGEPMYPENYADANEMHDAMSAWMDEMFAKKEIPRVYR